MQQVQSIQHAIPNKLYFRIGEVSDLVGVKPYVLRYWESEFSDIRPAKSKSGQRLYKRRDVELLMKIRGLLYDERFTINGARRRLKDWSQEQGHEFSEAHEPELVPDELIDNEVPTEVLAAESSSTSLENSTPHYDISLQPSETAPLVRPVVLPLRTDFRPQATAQNGIAEFKQSMREVKAMPTKPAPDNRKLLTKIRRELEDMLQAVKMS